MSGGGNAGYVQKSEGLSHAREIKIFHGRRQKNEKKKKVNQWRYVKGTQDPIEKVPNDQNWNNFKNKLKQYLTIAQCVKYVFTSPQ